MDGVGLGLPFGFGGSGRIQASLAAASLDFCSSSLERPASSIDPIGRRAPPSARPPAPAGRHQWPRRRLWPLAASSCWVGSCVRPPASRRPRLADSAPDPRCYPRCNSLQQPAAARRCAVRLLLQASIEIGSRPKCGPARLPPVPRMRPLPVRLDRPTAGASPLARHSRHPHLQTRVTNPRPLPPTDTHTPHSDERWPPRRSHSPTSSPPRSAGWGARAPASASAPAAAPCLQHRLQRRRGGGR